MSSSAISGQLGTEHGLLEAGLMGGKHRAMDFNLLRPV